jgi:hypothetical protein
VWRTWAYARTGNNNESQSHRDRVSPTALNFDDLKGVPGVDLPSTVTTEITGGPRPLSHDPKNEEGPSPKARKLLGWFRRASFEEPRRRSGIEEEDVGLHALGQIPGAGGVNASLETTRGASTTTGITVQYDIRRTVEELRRESSSQEGDCITCIDEVDSRKEDHGV